jgi:hypothetical protein
MLRVRQTTKSTAYNCASNDAGHDISKAGDCAKWRTSGYSINPIGQWQNRHVLHCVICLLNTQLAAFHPDFSMVTAAVNPERQVIGPVLIMRRILYFLKD